MSSSSATPGAGLTFTMSVIVIPVYFVMSPAPRVADDDEDLPCHLNLEKLDENSIVLYLLTLYPL